MSWSSDRQRRALFAPRKYRTASACLVEIDAVQLRQRARRLFLDPADQAAGIRINGDKFSWDVLGKNKGMSDGNNADRLSLVLAGQAPHAAVDGGRQGFHCITHMALAADRRTLLYVSEGGRRIMRFDLQSEQQLPDFLGFAADDLRGTFGPAVLADGKVWIATGRGADCLAPDGQLLCSVAPDIERGWSRLTLANDGASFFLGNFLAGILEQRSSADGQLVASLDIRRRYSLSGVVQVP